MALELTTQPTDTIDLADILYFVDVSETPDAINQNTYGNILGSNLSQLRALTDPNADRLLFWDDSAGAYTHLTLGTNLSITGTTLDAAGGGGIGGSTGATDNAILRADGAGGSTMQSSGLIVTDDDKITDSTGNCALVFSNGGGVSYLAYQTSSVNVLTTSIRFYPSATLVATIDGSGLALNAKPLQLAEQTAPSAPAANTVYIYAQDNGAGKTQLMALFSSGVAQQIALQP